MNIFPFFHWDRFADTANETLQKHFGVATLAGFALEDKPFACQAAAALLGYLQETQKATIPHIQKISSIENGQTLLLDRSTMINLELFTTIREHNTKGTLISVLDQTITAMGGRLLREWLKKPLVEHDDINNRHEAVAVFLQDREKREKLRTLLEEVTDIERLISRLSVGLGNGRDLVNLKSSLQTIIVIKNLMKDFDAPLLKELTKNIETNEKDKKMTINDIITFIHVNILPEPPISIREGKMIQQGVNKELDRLRTIVSGSRLWILDLEKKERAATGITSLKVRFNQVFGFYIEVSRANLSAVPSSYMRKQTLVNAERFITPELKKQEEIILTAEEKIHELEYQLFQKTVQEILVNVRTIQDTAASIAAIDCLCSFALNAEKNNYVRPKLLYSGEIRITDGRHPVVETLLQEKQFVPNNVTLDNTNQQMLLITGPNMAGKSVLIRQIALIVLMNQIGCFVPAKSAYLSIVDRIFVRSGASDVITSGLSTFMVEMVETAYILNHATNKSLIIMDEIGRGTSTYDGISIAWAIAEYLVTHHNPKTLFATHYHELQVLEEHYPKQIKNFHMAVVSDKEEPIFLHTLVQGGASHSFGVAVAKLAGIPQEVIIRANRLLHDLEKRGEKSSSIAIEKQREQSQVTAFPRTINMTEHVLKKELEHLDLHTMTPIEAMNKLSELKEKLKLFTQDKEFMQAD